MAERSNKRMSESSCRRDLGHEDQIFLKNKQVWRFSCNKGEKIEIILVQLPWLLIIFEHFRS